MTERPCRNKSPSSRSGGETLGVPANGKTVAEVNPAVARLLFPLFSLFSLFVGDGIAGIAAIAGGVDSPRISARAA